MNKRQETLNEVLEMIMAHHYHIESFWESYTASQIFRGILEDRQHWISVLERMIEESKDNNG
jgi:hypothetical protein